MLHILTFPDGRLAVVVIGINGMAIIPGLIASWDVFFRTISNRDALTNRLLTVPGWSVTPAPEWVADGFLALRDEIAEGDAYIRSLQTNGQTH